MSELRKAMPLREAYGLALRELGGLRQDVVVLEADVGGSTRSALFGAAYPERYYNVGIAEQNMAAMAAGMASQGLMPWVNTFATFLTTRGVDPIQSLICYDRLNVKLVGAYCGMSDSFDGASHNSISDIAIMRAIPNMTVLSVCDPVETEKAVFAAAELHGPVYLRVSRAETPCIYGDSFELRVGRGVVVKDGGDVTLIATGYMVHKALEAAERLKARGVDAAVLDIHTIKPLDAQLITQYAEKTGAVVTVEEHSVCGGLGGAVAEALSATRPTPMELVGITDFGESGLYEALLSKYGLDAAAIEEKALTVINRKER